MDRPPEGLLEGFEAGGGRRKQEAILEVEIGTPLDRIDRAAEDLKEESKVLAAPELGVGARHGAQPAEKERSRVLGPRVVVEPLDVRRGDDRPDGERGRLYLRDGERPRERAPRAAVRAHLRDLDEIIAGRN